MYKTKQEALWAGEFGDRYVERNSYGLPSCIHFFAQALRMAHKIGSIIEFGANVGFNLRALEQLYPGAHIDAIEINPNACAKVETYGFVNKAYNESILEFQAEREYDLALIKGVLIHVDPEELQNVYERLYAASRRYLLVGEYYNPTPVALPYRGEGEALFKRDFAGEMLDRYPDLSLVDYGFVYHRDNKYPQDDLTWFLMEKRG